MSVLQALLSFTIASCLLTMTPGLDTALVLRTAAVKGQRQAFVVAAGTAVGCLIWCALVSLGLGALLLMSQAIYNALRMVGACYLLFLGAQMILKSRKRPSLHSSLNEAFPSVAAEAKTDGTLKSCFYQGFFNNLLNPKVGIFYVTFLPQFIPVGINISSFGLLLGIIHAVEGLLWFSVLILATRSLSVWLKQPQISRRLDRVTGSILILFGLKLALEPRHVR